MSISLYIYLLMLHA